MIVTERMQNEIFQAFFFVDQIESRHINVNSYRQFYLSFSLVFEFCRSYILSAFPTLPSNSGTLAAHPVHSSSIIA